MSLADAAAGDNSMLSRKFGPEVVNYFSGSPLNRVSFLRQNTTFLRAALPAAKFLLLNNLDPLSSSRERLALVTYEDVRAVVGSPFDLDEEAFVQAFDSRVETPLLLFMGLDQTETETKSETETETEAEAGTGLGSSSSSFPSSSPSSSRFEFQGDGALYSGTPYFALDITPKGPLQEKCQALITRLSDGVREFRKVRMNLDLVPREAAIVAQARSLIDWNNRNVFCSACGGRTLSVHAGTKRTCPPYDRALQKALSDPPQERPPCVTRKGVHNTAFPRTDPTVIQAIVNAAGDKILLGRQSRWPKDFYSCLAGFLEPAESVEEAVRRETWEESGVRVGRVVLHSTQPWPFPASLMIGCIGQALPDGEKINLGHDPELHKADWFAISTVKEALSRSFTNIYDKPPADHKEGDLRLPPPTAIAHQLLLAVVNNYHVPAPAPPPPPSPPPKI